MGCDAIEGACMANPVYNLAVQAGILNKPLHFQNKTNNNLFCTSDGRAINQSVVYVATQVFNEIQRNAYSLFGSNSGNKHGSLYEFFSNFNSCKYNSFKLTKIYIFSITNSAGTQKISRGTTL